MYFSFSAYPPSGYPPSVIQVSELTTSAAVARQWRPTSARGLPKLTMALNPSLELKGLGTPNPHTMGLGTRDAYPVDTEAVNDLTAFSERAEALVQEEKLVRAKHTSSMKLEEDETKMAKEEHARIQMDIRLNGTDAHQAALVALRERATTAEQRAAAAKLQENADPNNKPPSPIAKLLSTVPGLQLIQPIPYGYAAAAIETPPRAVERPAPIVLNGSSMLENSRRGSNPTPPQDMDEEPEASSPLAFEEQPVKHPIEL